MSKTKIINSAGISSAALLAGLPAFLTLAPMFGVSEARADEPRTLGAAATVVPNLSLAADNLSIMMTPTGSGSIFKTGSIDAIVSTNNETGYTLYFSDKDLDTSLKHKNLAGQEIVSTASAATGTEMLANTWGYTLSDAVVAEGENESNNATNLALTYESIPVDYTAIKTTETQTSGETSKLTFGVKIDNSIPSGVYSDEVLISAVINYSGAGYDQSRLWLNKNGVQISTMQEMTYDVCEAVPTPTVTATGSNVPEIELTDTRDSKKYKVRKLVDGNCWMVENLNLVGGTTLTPADSHVTQERSIPASSASGFSDNDTAYVYNTPDPDTNKYGGYYSWRAATAGTAGTDKTSGDASSEDICPKGWQLPTVAEINAITRYRDAFSPVLAGHYYSVSLYHAGSTGYYWASTASSDTFAHRLYVTSSMTTNSGAKQYGFSVRCVAQGTGKTTPATATYMQDVEACPSSLPEGRQYTLTDSRDGKSYTVAKLADGKCWMTKNLNLVGGSTLTPADSNVTQERSIPASSTTGFSDDDVAYVYNTPEPDTNKYGGYYSWRAATAGTAGTDKTSGDASEDICPKGWRLPKKAEFDSLRTTTGWPNAAAWTAAPFNGVLAGSYNNSSPYHVGSGGVYWSSTVNSANYAYRLVFVGSELDTLYDNKMYGRSVRCVFDS